MNAPLPEVPPLVPKKRDFAKAAPIGLRVFCAADAITVVLLTLVHTPTPEISRFWDWTIYTLITAFALALTYYLWRGYGWARRLWLWLTILSLPFLFSTQTPQTSLVEQGATYFNWALNLFSLVYLNLPNVKAHFAQRKTVE